MPPDEAGWRPIGSPVEKIGDIGAWRPEASIPGRSVGWLAGWLACWLAGWLVGWLAGWLGWLAMLAGWLACWLAGWLAGLAGCLRLAAAGWLLAGCCWLAD